VVHTFNPSTWEAVDLCEFKAILICMVGSRISRSYIVISCQRGRGGERGGREGEERERKKREGEGERARTLSGIPSYLGFR